MFTFQRQGEEDRSGGEVHLPDGPPHPQHQGCPFNTGNFWIFILIQFVAFHNLTPTLSADHHPTEAGRKKF